MEKEKRKLKILFIIHFWLLPLNSVNLIKISESRVVSKIGIPKFFFLAFLKDLLLSKNHPIKKENMDLICKKSWFCILMIYIYSLLILLIYISRLNKLLRKH